MSGSGGLGILGLSTSSFIIGTPFDGTITGATPGSTITSSDLPSYITINSTARTFHYDGTGSTTASTFHLTETLAPFNPVTSTVGFSLFTIVTYDTSIGNGVDALGFASLPLRVGATRYYVNSSTGSDSNTGTSSSPVKTLAKAISLVTGGNGDQVLIAEGTTYTEDWGTGVATYPTLNGGSDFSTKGGFSAVYPTVIQSYDPTDPTNEAKLGRGVIRGNPPVFTANITQAGPTTTWAYFAIRGIKFDNESTTVNHFFNAIEGNVSYLLFEANYFKNYQLDVQSSNDEFVAPWSTPTNLIIRNNVWDTPWDVTVLSGGNGRVGALFVDGYNGITWEDNFVYHNGWGPTQTRSTVVSAQDETHPIYESPVNTNFIGRRNLIIDPSADGGGVRGDGLLTENVLIGSPAGFGLGPPSTETQFRHNGEDLRASYNLIMAGIDFNPGGVDPKSKGIDSNLGRPGSSIDHNVIIHGNPHGTAFSNIAWSTTSFQSYMEIHHNIVSDWTDSGATFFTQAGANAAYSVPFTTYDYNIWDNPTSGTNTNVGSVTFPNAYTETSLYAAAGYASKSALVSAMLANPTLHVQRTLRALAFAGYGQPLDDAHLNDTTAPTLSSPTASSPSAGNATIGVTTNEANGRLFGVLLPTASAVTPPTLNAPSSGTTGGSLRVHPYFYKVTAITPTGETLPSNEVSITPTTTTATVSLSWSAVSGATGYKVYRGVQSGINNLSVTLGNTTTFTDFDNIFFSNSNAGGEATSPPVLNAPSTSTTGGALAAGTYFYVVAAQMPPGDNTASSNEVSVTTTGNASTVSLSWSSVPGAIAYAVFRGTSSGLENIQFNTALNTSLTDSGVMMSPGSPPNTITGAQIKMGLNTAGAAVPAGNQTVTTTGAKTLSLSSVPPGTYQAWFVHEDAAGNKSALATSSSFTVANASTTWASNADWTLSNGNLTALRSGTSTFNGMLHASAAKSNGTVIWTINAMGSAAFNYVGFDNGSEANSLGSSGAGNSIGYRNNGDIVFASSLITTVASWTTGDAIKITDAAGVFSFYKNNVLQTTIDTTSVSFGVGTVMAGNVFPAVTTQNATGFQTTTNFTGW
jgi:hypothetical protein